MMHPRAGNARIPVLLIAVLASLSVILHFHPPSRKKTPPVRAKIAAPAPSESVARVTASPNEPAVAPEAGSGASASWRDGFLALSKRTAPVSADAHDDVSASLPADYLEGLVVESRGARLRQSLLGARSSAKTGDAREATYPEVLPGVDAIVLTGPARVEEFLRIRPGTASSFTYQMTLESPSHSFSTENGLTVVDEQNLSVLQLDPLVYWTAGEDGEKEVSSTLRLSGSRIALLTIDLPADALDEEILLDPSWSSTGSMAYARNFFTATLLNNGKVLVAGGMDMTYSWGKSTASCILYDPSTGTWSATGSMRSDRYAHSAVLLADGRVLVAGGDSQLKPNVAPKSWRTAEIYNPATGAWALTASMSVAHSGHQAIRLMDGRALHVGSPCEIYNPATAKWSSAAPIPINMGQIVLLDSGNVLMTGAYGAQATSFPTALYNPGSNSWSLTGNLSYAHAFAAIAKLPNGTVLIAGGETPNVPYDGSWHAIDSCEIYDPATGVWNLAGSMLTTRSAAPAARLSDGRVLVSGGRFTSRYTNPTATCEIYDPATGLWSTAANMAEGRMSHYAIPLQTGHVLALGGANLSSGNVFNSAMRTCERYTP